MAPEENLFLQQKCASIKDWSAFESDTEEVGNSIQERPAEGARIFVSGWEHLQGATPRYEFRSRSWSRSHRWLWRWGS